MSASELPASTETQMPKEGNSSHNWNAYLDSAWEDLPTSETFMPQPPPVEDIFHVEPVPKVQRDISSKTLELFNLQQKFIEEITAEKELQITHLQQQNMALTDKFAHLEAEYQIKQKDYDSLTSRCTDFQQQTDRANHIIQQFERQKANFREKSHRLVHTLDELKVENNRLRTKVVDLQGSPMKSNLPTLEQLLHLPPYNAATSIEWRKDFLADPDIASYFQTAPISLQESFNFDPRFRRRLPLTSTEGKPNWVIVPGIDWADTKSIIGNLQAFVKMAQLSPDPIVYDQAKFVKLLEIIITPHTSAKDTLININPNLSCRKTKMDTALFIKANHLPAVLLTLFEKMAETGFLINASSAYWDSKAAIHGKRRKEIYTFYQHYKHVHVREGGERLLSTKVGNNDDNENKQEDENAMLETLFDLDEDEDNDEERHFKRHRH